MPITKRVRVPHGFERTGTAFQEISEGVAPHVRALKVADYLPVVVEDRHLELFKVVFAGTHLSFDSARRAVPNMGLTLPFVTGTASYQVVPVHITPGLTLVRHLVFTNDDIGNTIHPDTSYTTKEVIDSVDAATGNAGHSGGGAIAATLPGSRPLGYAPFDLYSSAAEELFLNYPGSQEHISMVADYFYEIPLRAFNELNSVEAASVGLRVNSAGNGKYGDAALIAGGTFAGYTPAAPGTAWTPGALLVTDWAGRLIRYTGPDGIDPDATGTSFVGDDVSQIVGRVWEVYTIRPAGGQYDRRELVRTYPGSGLGPSSQNDGVSQWLDYRWDPDGFTTQASTVKALKAARVQTTLLS